MHIRPTRIRHFGGVFAAVAMLAVAVLTHSCTPFLPEPILAARVPAAIRADGFFTIAIDATYPPATSMHGNNGASGFDIDLLTAVATKLDLEARWKPTQFDRIIPAVQSGQAQLGAAAIPITDARLQDVVMVAYLNSGTQWLNRTTARPIDPQNACGKRIAALSGTAHIDELTDRSRACVAANRPEITISAYDDPQRMSAAVARGADDALVGDAILCAGLAAGDIPLKVAVTTYDPHSLGWVSRSTDRQFADLLASALEAVVKDGSYDRILRRWRLQDQAAAIRVRP
ncbi:ABC transporter substrate-binding protein [Virgisporangium aliadipatigenens]|uniref:ABC transporter substrate-binding protein n=1 Tax=Virgisporangium aliadipatigenens TaxID=741659 RepID=A0A8J3YTT4_9ACTN|nr:ABC transporter substrate-binding protein [Virgisporangium aliadipatigenens]